MASFIAPTNNALPASTSLPPTSLLIRDKNAITLFQGPNVLDNGHPELSFSMTSALFPATAALRMPPIYDTSGNLLCLVPERERPAVYETSSFTKLVEFDVTDATRAEFSNLGKYLVTWSMPTKGGESPTGNLRIWSVASGELVAHYSQKTFKPDLIQWAVDDTFCFRQVSNEIHVYDATASLAPNGTIAKVLHQGFTQFKIAKIENENKVNIAVFNPEAGGKPARVTLFAFQTNTATVEGPLNSRTIFGATEANLLWNKTGLTLLIHSQSDIDSSNNSYYGAMGLYLMSSKSDLSMKVEQTKEGPVHAVQWSPVGDRFAVVAGTMPCQGTLHNEKGEPVYQFGAAHRNLVSWSPHGRFLCLAGFGNLAGEMDFYDTLRLKKIGSNISHCATSFGWSPDSRYFMTASLAPRMNVDNCFKLFKYNGIGPIYQQDFEKAYDAIWRPAAYGLYPNRPPTPPRRGSEGEVVNTIAPQKASTPAPTPYRPPHSTGALANFMKDTSASAAPVGKVKKDEPAKFVPTMQKQRVIPGMAPVQANQQKKKTPTPNPASSVPAKSNATPAAPTKSAAPVPLTPAVKPSSTPSSAVESAESKEKRAKAIQKKLKQIQEIKEKLATGQPVEPEQLKKIESESSLQRELESLR